MGRIWKFGDDVNTDVIIPARYNITIDPQELAKYVFCEDRPDLPKEAQQGDILIAGENFGCGSSREHAPIAIKAAGITAVVAKSYARIFHRNAMNIGLAVLETDEDLDVFSDGDNAEVDLSTGVLRSTTGNAHIQTKPLPQVMIQLIEAGGLASFVRDHDIEELVT
ncbi:MAG: 3-isopropylmalate dehydratase small subunit [Bdellovibrionales bacterium]|nr:3-isopropylmalate dehydratase small subunit [Bdellovibrionales bacterium]